VGLSSVDFSEIINLKLFLESFQKTGYVNIKSQVQSVNNHPERQWFSIFILAGFSVLLQMEN